MQRIFEQMEFLRRHIPLRQKERFLSLFILTDIRYKDYMPRAPALQEHIPAGKV